METDRQKDENPEDYRPKDTTEKPRARPKSLEQGRPFGLEFRRVVDEGHLWEGEGRRSTVWKCPPIRKWSERQFAARRKQAICARKFKGRLHENKQTFFSVFLLQETGGYFRPSGCPKRSEFGRKIPQFRCARRSATSASGRCEIAEFRANRKRNLELVQLPAGRPASGSS